MSKFRISGALWDRIHHFAAFPQTGGEAQDVPGRDNSMKANSDHSIAPADGTLRPEPGPRDAFESIAILVGRAAHPTVAPYSRAGSAAGRSEQDAEYTESQRVVCSEF